MGNCTSATDALPLPPSPQEVFQMALKGKDIDNTLEELISSHVDVNCNMKHDSLGSCYPIHLATEMGKVQVVEVLLKAGADPSLKDEKGQTALHWAVERNHKDIVEKLIDASSGVNSKAQDGSTPLTICIQTNNEDIAETLIKHGANVDASEEDEESPIILAAKLNRPTLLVILIKAQAKVKGILVPLPDGKTECLHSWAKRNEYYEILEAMEEKESCDCISTNPFEQTETVERTKEMTENEEEKTNKEAEDDLEARTGGDGAEEVTNISEETKESVPEQPKVTDSVIEEKTEEILPSTNDTTEEVPSPTGENTEEVLNAADSVSEQPAEELDQIEPVTAEG